MSETLKVTYDPDYLAAQVEYLRTWARGADCDDDPTTEAAVLAAFAVLDLVDQLQPAHAALLERVAQLEGALSDIERVAARCHWEAGSLESDDSYVAYQHYSRIVSMARSALAASATDTED